MTVRSQFLVHWPGKDINGEKCDDDAKRDLYVDRLRDSYVNGLFARQVEEGAIRGMKLKRLVRICFTEIRLSQIETHTRRYGKLGLGFDRKFVLNRGGRPVIYIPFQAKDKLMEETMRFVYDNSNGTVRDRLRWLFAFVKRMSDRPTTHKDSQDRRIGVESCVWRKARFWLLHANA